MKTGKNKNSRKTLINSDVTHCETYIHVRTSFLSIVRSSSNSFLRAQHTLRETEKLLSTVHCSSDHGKDTEGPKVVDRIKNYSPLKMTRSMSLRKKSRPTPPPPKPEVVPSGMTEEQIYLSQVSVYVVYL